MANRFLQQALTIGIYGVSSLIGLVAFLYPFFASIEQTTAFGATRSAESPLLTVILLVLCLVALLIEVQGQAASAKVVAALGVLIAIASVLRFIETAIPGPGGFSPIFAPIILVGYVFGARMGFLMGALTLLVSGLITASVGPWLPYQMFTAGWIGLAAGWLPKLRSERWQIVMLAAYGLFVGMAFGVLMNLYFWPFVVGDASSSWIPGSTLGEGIGRYLIFYAASSLVWDFFRGLGNLLLLLAVGNPAVRALRRFRDRFQFEAAYTLG